MTYMETEPFYLVEKVLTKEFKFYYDVYSFFDNQLIKCSGEQTTSFKKSQRLTISQRKHLRV